MWMRFYLQKRKERKMDKPHSTPRKSQPKDNYKDNVNKLFKALYDKPMSRRMAATFIGYNDQTYMVTQYIYDWIKQGKASTVGVIKCKRSGRIVDAITTNPKLFPKSNQFKMDFGHEA